MRLFDGLQLVQDSGESASKTPGVWPLLMRA